MKVYIYNFYQDVFHKTQYVVEKNLICSISSMRFSGLIERGNTIELFFLVNLNKLRRSGIFCSLRKLSKNEIKKLGSHWRKLNEDILL